MPGEIACPDCGVEQPSMAFLKEHQEGYCVAADQKDKKKGGKKERKPAASKNGEGKILVGRLEVPEADPDYYISHEVATEIRRIIQLVEREPENIGIVGPKGSGKTSLARQIAALRRSPMYLGNAYTQRSSDEWFGREGVSLERGSFYVQSLFVEAIETEGATVIINDLALMQNKAVQNGLNDLLDPSVRQVWIDQLAEILKRPIKVADRVLIIATWNEGAGYTGNVQLSDNLRDRFMNRIYMGYPPKEAQIAILMRKADVDATSAERLVKYGEILSSDPQDPVEVSLRSLIQAGKKMILGAHVRDALYFTIISGLHPRYQEKALMAMEAIFTPDEKTAVATRSGAWSSWDDDGEDWITTDLDPAVTDSWQRAAQGFRPGSKANA